MDCSETYINCVKDESKVSSKITKLSDLIARCHQEFSGETYDIKRIQDLMESYNGDSADWKTYENWDAVKYTRNLVDGGNGKFNLMLLCWSAGQGSPVHNHSNAHCVMKILSGTLSEVRYEYPEGNDQEELVETSRLDLCTNDVSYINDTIGLHRVENPSHSEGAMSLHLYCPPFMTCTMFDERTGQQTQCKMSFFWSEYGKLTEV